MTALLLSLLLSATPALSLPEEARAQALMQEIRCVVCDGQPISESNAEIAKDMRKIVLEQVAEGRSDSEIRDWFLQRYGESALLRPTLGGAGGPLWFAPLVLLGVAAIVVARVMRFDRNVNNSDRE